jgi:hypothetical protein
MVTGLTIDTLDYDVQCSGASHDYCTYAEDCNSFCLSIDKKFHEGYTGGGRIGTCPEYPDSNKCACCKPGH